MKRNQKHAFRLATALNAATVWLGYLWLGYLWLGHCGLAIDVRKLVLTPQAKAQ
jgi:hypothetical protein